MDLKIFYKNLPEEPGAYLMKDKDGRVLYVGKAGNLKRRVSGYFEKPHDYRIEKLVSAIQKIDFQETDTAIEALILESELIKKFSPPFNVKEKDDKSFLFAEITDEKYPRVLLVRGKNKLGGWRFGPFTSATSIRQALRIVRKIFPFSTHPADKIGKFNRSCFDYEIGLCPGTCINAITEKEYSQNIKNIKLFFGGKKKEILKSLEKDMKKASKDLEYERAEKIKRQIFSLQHIQDIALITDDNFKLSGVKKERIEGYDVSNISGTSVVGVMVVFTSGKTDKNEYRKFRIRTINESNDAGMLKETIKRRFNNNWPLPDLVLVDGGISQVNVAKEVLEESGLKIPVIGIAKGPSRKKNEFIGSAFKNFNKELLIKVRDEAHRFAIKYHRELRSSRFMNS